MFALGREDRLEKECGVACSSSMAEYDDVFSHCAIVDAGVQCERFHIFQIRSYADLGPVIPRKLGSISKIIAIRIRILT